MGRADESRIPRAWIVVGAATLAQAGSSFVLQGLGALAGFLQESFLLGTTAVGLLITVAGLPTIIGLLGVGDLLDRRHEGKIVFAGAMITAGGALLVALAPGFGWLLAGLLIIGAGYSTAQPGGSKAVAGWFDDRRRGLALGIRQAGLPAGGALAAVVLPIVAHRHGWPWAFAVDAVVVALAGTVFLLAYRRPPGPPPSSARTPLRDRLAAGLAHRPLRIVLLAGISLVAAQFGIQTYLMIFLRDSQAIPLTDSAWLLALVQLAGVAGRILLAVWSDRPGHTRLGPVASCLAVTGLGLIMLPLLPTGTPAPALAAVVIMLGFFGFGWYGPWVARIAEIAPPGRTGLMLGLAMAGNQFAIVAAPPLLGLLHDLTGSYRVLWWTPAALLLIVAPITLRRR